MARYVYGGGMSDFAVAVISGAHRNPGPVEVTFWSAFSGGDQFTDLLIDGVPATSYRAGSEGHIGTGGLLKGPDGIGVMWAQAGDDPRRYRMVADVGGAVEAAQTAAASAQAALAEIPATVTAAVGPAVETAVDEKVDELGFPTVEQAPHLADDEVGIRLDDEDDYGLRWTPRGLTSPVTPQALPAGLVESSLSKGAGTTTLDLEGSGWMHAIITRDPGTGVRRVAFGIRNDGTFYPDFAQGGGTAVDETSATQWAWLGDSMSLGLSSRLATATGWDVVDGAIGGERSYDIAARPSANPMIATIDGNAIPASGPVFVTPRTSDKVTTVTLMKQGSKLVNPVSIAGVTGTLAWVEADGRYRFTRAADGAAVPVPYPVPILTFGRDAYSSRSLIIQIGRNNTSELDRIVEDVHALTHWLRPGRRRFLVGAISTSGAEVVGTNGYNTVAAINAALKKEFGFRFVDWRRRLVDEGLARAGIIPTPQDEADVAGDTVPISLRSDVLHLNDAGKDVQITSYTDRLRAIGWN